MDEEQRSIDPITASRVCAEIAWMREVLVKLVSKMSRMETALCEAIHADERFRRESKEMADLMRKERGK
jgi:hypothetical protein